MSAVAGTDVMVRAARALGLARDHLLGLQHQEGWWKGEVETNVTIEAEDLLLRYFLGILRDDERRLTGNWIRSKQREDGTWGNFYGAPAELSTTVEAYVALRLAGDSPDDERMKRASAWIREQGGVEATRVFTRTWLALNGWWSWDELPATPPELVFAPSWFPLNIYDFACWARQTIMPLSIVRHHKPSKQSPFPIDELLAGKAPPPERSPKTWTGRFHWIDRLLRIYERRPFRPLRAVSLERAENWIVRRQEADGSWGGLQPSWVYSIIALHLRGYPLDHPSLQRAFDGLERFTIVEKDMRRMEACQSPVWDTALAVIGLADSGMPRDHPILVRAASWLMGKENELRGDWAVRRPKLQPGGWAFEFANSNYPDVDDTAEVVMALRAVDQPDSEQRDAAVQRGVQWTLGMQSRDGGWGAFDADNTQNLCRAHPFCDFGEVIDPPSADVTGHALEMLAGEGLADTPAAHRGLAWLRGEQEENGSWFGRWGANYVYGLGAVVPALAAAGVPAHDPAIRRAVQWLESHQNEDGGWGEDLRSYDDAAWSGRGASTASQTAWALLALLPAGARSEAVERGVNYLASTQRADGTWDEPWFTGTGFPGDFYVNYHLYRLVFPLMALGRYVNGRREEHAEPSTNSSH